MRAGGFFHIDQENKNIPVRFLAWVAILFIDKEMAHPILAGIG
tara:strand:- start:1292 stop:1420 length:129 start_codon:yes stop_codon:yes gene_type:complete